MPLTKYQLNLIRRNSKRARELLQRHVKEGDLLTHTRCCGFMEEHIFVGWDGEWMKGTATRDTMKYSEFAMRSVNDIAPINVTHVNREPVRSLEFSAQQALGPGFPDSPPPA